MTMHDPCRVPPARRFAFPSLLGLAVLLFPAPATGASEAGGAEKAGGRELRLVVEGMQSSACEIYLTETLLYEVDGVEEAEADHETGDVRVVFEGDEAMRERIVEAINGKSCFEVKEVREPAGEGSGDEP